MKETGRSLFPYAKEIDISKELYRVYVWANGEQLKINKPRTLVVSDNGHRVVDGNYIAFYVAYGWLYLYWENEDKEQFQYYYQRQRTKQ